MTQFERILLKHLAGLKETKTNVLIHTVLSQTEYHLQMGYMQCLRDLETLLEEVRTEISEG